MNKIVAEVMGEILPDGRIPDENSLQKTLRVIGNLFDVNQDRQNHEPLLQITGVPVLQMKHYTMDNDVNGFQTGGTVSPVANTYRDNYSNFESEMEDSNWSKTLEVTKILLSGGVIS